MAAPLEGIRVIELARILAGPWAGQTLADLGPRSSRLKRQRATTPAAGARPSSSGQTPMARPTGVLPISRVQPWQEGHHLRLRHAGGAGAVRRLVAEADVVIENFKVGGLKKFGLDWESLRQVNPRLIYCSITGFGQTGPMPTARDTTSSSRAWPG